MQRIKKHLQSSLLIAVFVLGGFVNSYAQTTSGTTAPESQQNHVVQDSDTLKALEVANIRLAAANETIRLLNDRLAAKDAVIEAKDGLIAVRDEQLALAKSANQDRTQVISGDTFMLRACEQQLSRADAEIARLRSPGFFRSLFDKKSITGAVVGFGIGRATK